MEKRFDVEGMKCAVCQASVAKAVSAVPGVEKVDVDLLGKQMFVRFDEHKATPLAIVQAVGKAGFSASGEGVSAAPRGSGGPALPSEKLRLQISIPILLVLMYIAMGIHMGLPLPGIFDNPLVFAAAQLALSLPIIIVNRKFYSSGFKALARREPNMDSLVAVGSSAAILYGVWSIVKIALAGPGSAQAAKYASNLYFESGAMILALVTVGKYLEERAKRKTTGAVSKLMDLAPRKATVVRGGANVEVDIEELGVGDIILVKPGESVCVDGEVVKGASAVDESMITGEPIPVEKFEGSQVISATINKTGTLWVRAGRVGSDTTLSQIIDMVRRSGASKARVSRLADKVAAIFVPVVMSIALAAFVIWLAVGAGFEFALRIGISILVISCPCALGLATPVAVTVSIGNLASRGILAKSAQAVETAAKLSVVVLDKTGTITEGRPVAVGAATAPGVAEEELLEAAASLESLSEHVLSTAIVNYAKEKGTRLAEVSDFAAQPGYGISGSIGGQPCQGGSANYMARLGLSIAPLEEASRPYLEDGCTPMYFALGGRLLGALFASDEIKESSAQAVAELKGLGVEVAMLTGDSEQAARAVGRRVGVDRVIARVLPNEKADRIVELKKGGRLVGMVGDGINDSPALAVADVGFAIGGGTDIAIDSADVVLLRNSLADVARMVSFARKTMTNIKENLFWAFFYNVIGIPIAAGVLYPAFGIALTPMIGSACMSISSIFVTLNALRLRRK